MPGAGLGGYAHLDIVIKDPDSGMFVEFTETATGNVDPGGDPPVSNSEIRDANGNPTQTGSVVYLDADLADGAFDGAGEIVIAELDTVVTGIDTSPVTLTVEAGLQDLDGIEYTVENTTGSVLEPVGSTRTATVNRPPISTGTRGSRMSTVTRSSPSSTCSRFSFTSIIQ